MKIKKSDIKQLKYPLWFTLLFFALTILAPIILVIIAGMKAPADIEGTVFKISFTVICIAIIAWFFIKKLLINKIETKLIAKQANLEHDYAIGNGNLDKIKYLWFQNEKKLALFQLVSIALYGGLIVTILYGVVQKLMEMTNIAIAIMTLYVIAYTIKFMLLILAKGGDDDETENADTTENG